MPRTARPKEEHFGDRALWLRAAVLGANDGIVSAASLIFGVAAAGASVGAIVTAGVAGLVAGALSGLAGEPVHLASALGARTVQPALAVAGAPLAVRPEALRQRFTRVLIGVRFCSGPGPESLANSRE